MRDYSSNNIIIAKANPQQYENSTLMHWGFMYV